MPRRCNGCYSYASKQKGEWWLIRLGTALVAVVLGGGMVFLVFWAVTPLQVKAQIDDARLSKFSMAATTTTRMTTPPSLAYNISIALTLHNLNGASVTYTKPLLAAFVFHDRLLRNITIIAEGTRQPKLRKKLHLGHADGIVPPYVLDAGAEKDFEKQNATGIFKLEVRLSGEIAFRGLQRIGKKRELALSCPLSLQLSPPGPAVVVFRKVRCKLEEPQKLYF